MTISNNSDSSLLLGKETVYKNKYDANLLYPIARLNTRQALLESGSLPFEGIDVWTAYEVSWLNAQGKPQLRLAEFTFSHNTTNIVESKSFKLYLNSFNQTKFASEDEVKRTMLKDLTQAADGEVSVSFYGLDSTGELVIDELPGYCIDEYNIHVEHYHPEPSLLLSADFPENNALSEAEQGHGVLGKKANKIDGLGDIVSNELLYSHLLKTNCPVTNQPDWATIFIAYSGKKIHPENLLSYLISFREHQDFHENCVEQIFIDIQQKCQPSSLAVYARYTRRGGLDINPLRCSLDNSFGQLFGGLRLRTRRQ